MYHWIGNIDVAVASEVGLSIPGVIADTTISPNEAARQLKVTGDAVKSWIYSGKLPATKLSNGYWRIRLEDINNFLAKRYRLRCQLFIVTTDVNLRKKLTPALSGITDELVFSDNYADAVLKCTSVIPDLAIIDIDKFADAWLLVDKLHSMKPRLALARMPIILITNTELLDGQMQLATKLNLAACFRRPIDTAIMVSEVRRLLRMPNA